MVSTMSQWTDMYRQKLTTPEEAVKLVKSGDWVDYGMATSQPILLDKALAGRKEELKDVKVRMSFTFAPREIISVDPNRKTFTAMNWHMSGYDRKMCAQGLMNCTFDRDSGGRYGQAVQEAVARERFKADINKGRYEAALEEENRTFLQELPAAQRSLLKLRLRWPGAYTLLEKGWRFLQSRKQS